MVEEVVAGAAIVVVRATVVGGSVLEGGVVGAAVVGVGVVVDVALSGAATIH